MSEEEKAVDRVAVYGWSTYEDEGFTGAFATPEEALKDAHDSVGTEDDIYVQEGYYGDVLELAPDTSLLIESTIDGIKERAYAECGEAADDWLDDLSDEQETELKEGLDQAIKAWMKKNLKMPAWTPVGDPMKYPGKAED